MTTSFLTGMAFIFFIMGHSTLLFFKSKENSSIPIINLILPWPKNGRMISFICIVLSFIFLFTALFLPHEANEQKSHYSLQITLVLIIIPGCIYTSYILKRIYKKPEGFLFISSEAKKIEWSTPLFFSAIVSFLFWLIK